MDHEFTKNGSALFFDLRLDSRLIVESAHEFRFFAQVLSLSLQRRRLKPRPATRWMPRYRANQSEATTVQTGHNISE
jgi:hypothetical protein